ncbi:MAG: PepSY-associated TM helix domain-containing protein [Bacteroidales bacterium]
MGNFEKKFRKFCRIIHRDLSYFLTGIILVYAISGLVLNHKDSFNPDYSIDRVEFTVSESFPRSAGNISEAELNKELENIKRSAPVMKFYAPKPNEVKVFIKGGSSMVINLSDRSAVYESIKKRPFFSQINWLHFNPKGWTIFADLVAIGLIFITLTGIFMNKGKNGLWGRGGIEVIIGILIPILFIFLQKS